jgi:hypothetical protein
MDASSSKTMLVEERYSTENYWNSLLSFLCKLLTLHTMSQMQDFICVHLSNLNESSSLATLFDAFYHEMSIVPELVLLEEFQQTTARVLRIVALMIGHYSALYFHHC